MNKQKRNDQPAPAPSAPKRADALEDVEEGDEIADVEENEQGQPGGGRRSESERPDSPDSRWGSDNG